MLEVHFFWQDEKFERLFKRYAVKAKLQIESLVFMFDGDKINLTATPDSLGMDDEDIIEVLAKKNWLTCPLMKFWYVIVSFQYLCLGWGMRCWIFTFVNYQNTHFWGLLGWYIKLYCMLILKLISSMLYANSSEACSCYNRGCKWLAILSCICSMNVSLLSYAPLPLSLRIWCFPCLQHILICLCTRLQFIVSLL